ncbi:hypothetical protein MD484_g4501, partial [Candolleomyces efflorescens]
MVGRAFVNVNDENIPPSRNAVLATSTEMLYGQGNHAQENPKSLPVPISSPPPVLQDKPQPIAPTAIDFDNVKRALAAACAFQAMLDAQKREVAGDVQENSFPCKTEMSWYATTATDERIDEFFQKSPSVWDQANHCWVGFDNLSRLKAGADLTDIVFNIVNAVIGEWGLSNRDGDSRRVRKASDLKLYHRDELRGLINNDYSNPSLVIEAQGPSFGLPPKVTDLPGSFPPEPDAKIGFATITTCIAVQMLASQLSPQAIKQQHAVYARQFFIQQPHRRFVRTLNVTEHAVRFFHFDRSGVHDEVFLDWEDTNPYEFVRLLLGVCSLDEEGLGFDTTIAWSIDSTGRKASGTLTARDEEKNTTKEYELLSLQPLFQSSSLFGRGTVCWVVRDPETGEELLVKDCWRGERGKAEHENLAIAKGLPGVVQMISYEDYRSQTKDYGVSRYLTPEERAGRYSQEVVPSNLIQSRIVMEKYGRRVGHLMSEMDTLCTIRDAIAGHMRLVLVGKTLHSDIAASNMVMGKPGAPVGNRGILIDMDHARLLCDIPKRPDVVGHYLNVSLSVLANGTSPFMGGRIIPHDYLDDLESSFFTTLEVMCIDEGPISPPNSTPLHDWVKHWCRSSQGSCFSNKNCKEQFLLSKKASDPAKYVMPYWGKTSQHLLKRFYMFTRKIEKAKDKIRWCNDDEKAEKKLRKLLSKTRQHYSHVLYLFDQAIRELERSMRGVKRSAGEEAVQELEEEPQLVRRTRQRRG